MKSQNKTKTNTTMKPAKAYSCYNIFFILERALLIDSKQNVASADNVASSRRTSSVSPSTFPSTNTAAAPLTGYESIAEILPPLPPRYQHLKNTLPANWYDPGRKSYTKRKHTKSHGGKNGFW